MGEDGEGHFKRHPEEELKGFCTKLSLEHLRKPKGLCLKMLVKS